MTKRFGYIAVLTWVFLTLGGLRYAPDAVISNPKAGPPQPPSLTVLQADREAEKSVLHGTDKKTINWEVVSFADPFERARQQILDLVGKLKDKDEAAYLALSAWTDSSQFLPILRQAIEKNESVELYSLLPKRPREWGAIEELQSSFGLSRQPLVEMNPWIVVVEFQRDGTPTVRTVPLKQ